MVGSGLLSISNVLAGPLGDAANLIFYREIYSHLHDAFDAFGARLFERMMTWAGAISLTVLTLWIVLHGYRITTGQSRESMAAFLIDMVKAIVVVSVATGTALAGGTLYDWVCNLLPNQINRLVADHDGDLYAGIDRTFGYMQVGLSSIGDIFTADNEGLEAAKTRNQGFVLLGAGLPAVTAGTLLLLYQASLAMLIGFAPLGVLSLLFKQTQSFFWNWLHYLLSVLVAQAVLSVMAAFLLDVVCAVAASFWAGKLLVSNPEGINSLAAQQGGLGLIFTVMLISVPAAVAKIFKGLLGEFMPVSAFGGGAAAAYSGHRPTPHPQARTHAHEGEHPQAPVQTHVHRVAAPARTGAQEDKIKPAEDEQSFLERYPNATASLKHHDGSGDELPPALLARAMNSGRPSLSADGYFEDSEVIRQPIPVLEKGAINGPKAIVLHRTVSSTAQSTLTAFERGVGTHFVIDKDGTIYQTASLSQRTAHVGPIRPRCLADGTCTPEEAEKLSSYGPAAGHRYEKQKSYPERYPMNEDSVGIEVVAMYSAETGQWDAPTAEQKKSIAYVVDLMKTRFPITDADIYEHDKISRKTAGEGSGLYDGPGGAPARLPPPFF